MTKRNPIAVAHAKRGAAGSGVHRNRNGQLKKGKLRKATKHRNPRYSHSRDARSD
jgi:hypothetical protein